LKHFDLKTVRVERAAESESKRVLNACKLSTSEFIIARKSLVILNSLKFDDKQMTNTSADKLGDTIKGIKQNTYMFCCCEDS
jgi:hypothetical protein